jgi:hypothetical protein
MIGAHSRKGEAPPSHFSFGKQIIIKEINVERLVEPGCAFAQAVD